MSLRRSLPIWAGALCALVVGAPVRGASGFDLEQRKQKQAWLWEAPRPQKIPIVRDASWPIVPEDFFILERLEKHGLKPSPAADDRTWLRRVHFVITGLPPTREEIGAFLADRSPGARARVVDGLLASPHYGERWTRHWMDLVRYAESRGHEGDYGIANAWHYRDYLIRAFNEDVPYNQFVMEHMAGDLLPKPRFRPGTDINESVLATGWPFLGEENHSPVDIRGDECERIDNKVDVFSKTFLGLTVSCARCHDHKFDPIRAQDYYALSGFMLGSSYRQVRFEAMENNRRMAEELEKLRAEYRPKLLKALAEASLPELSKFAEKLAGSAIQTNLVQPFALPPEGRMIADYTRPNQQPWKVDGEAFGKRPVAPGEVVFGRDPARPIASVATYGAARRDLFWNRLKSAPGNENDSGRLAATSRAGQMLRTPTVTLTGGKLHYLIRGKTRVYAAVDSHLMVEGPLHGILVKTFDTGPGESPKWVTHDLSAYSGHRAHFEFGPEGEGELEILMVVEAPDAPKWTPGAWPGTASAEEIRESLAVACRQLASGRIEPEYAACANWLVQNSHLPEAGVAREFALAQEQIAGKVRWESRTAVAWFDGTGVDEHVLLRGKPFKPGELAPRGLPAAFAGVKPISCTESSGRYELARQLIDPANPLVARVLVNRVWHHVFGRGIVASVDNFGELGDRPVNPELLDDMAARFVREDEWSLKRLIKRLVLSRAFAMSSTANDPRAEEQDPANALLHRMAVRRLEGEVIRDALLTVSGRLNPTVGGAPEPMYLTEFLVGRGRPEKSGPLDGDGRRSVYMTMRRNFLPTFMQTFDAPTPFSTVGKRNVTNVPGQSLAMMNDPLFHQQAEVWAKRLLCETAQADSQTRVGWLFECAFGRLPTERETSECLTALRELADLQGGTGQETWTELCHALLNSNEFIYVR